MAFIRSQVFCFFVAVFAVLFCVDLAYRVEGDVILRLANIGDDVTLSCNRSDLAYDNYKNWYRNGTFIANNHGVVINDPRFTQGVNNDGFRDSNNIHISNISMNDSATFQCRNFDYEEINTYELRVIRCSNCIIATHSNPDKPTHLTPLSFPTTTLSTTSLKQTTHNELLTLSYTASRKVLADRSTSISPTKHHAQKNKNASSDKNTRDGNITLIIVILGSVFILILIVIIVLRCKKTKDRQENKHIGNASIKKETPEVNYESLENGSQKGPQYATYMELRGTNREPKLTSKVTGRSSDSDHLYGNSAIITQHEQIRGILQQADQYENVKMPGSGDDAEEIPLYDMPDEGPTTNTLKATPEAGQRPTLSKDEVVSVDALYAEVD